MSYPFPLGGAAETCEAAMVVAGPWLKQLDAPDASDRWCQAYLRRLQEQGMKDGEVYEAVADATYMA